MFLPMTPDISENNAVDWGGDRLNPIQAVAGRIAFDAIQNIADNVGEGTGQLGADLVGAGNAFVKNPEISNFIKERGVDVEVRFASLWWNNECNFKPHYYVQECAKDTENIWIHFPWEHWWNAPV